MSHCSVAVLIPPDTADINRALTDILAPFDENTRVDPYPKPVDAAEVASMASTYGTAATPEAVLPHRQGQALGYKGASMTSVTYDADRSTTWTGVYNVASQSDATKTYIVSIDYRTGTTRCNCIAGGYDKPCKHKTWVREFDRQRWWTRLIEDMSPALREDFHDALLGRVQNGTATDDDRIAIKVFDAAMEALVAEWRRPKEARVA